MGFPIFMKGNGEVYERSNSWNCGCSWFSNCILFWWLGCRSYHSFNFYGVDYLSGLIVAGVFHKSNKTDTGSLESKTCWKGLCRKCMTLIFVLIAYRLDLVIGTNYIRDAVIIAFIGNELISLVENAGLMGVPLPAVITKAIDILQKKAEKDGE